MARTKKTSVEKSSQQKKTAAAVHNRAKFADTFKLPKVVLASSSLTHDLSADDHSRTEAKIGSGSGRKLKSERSKTSLPKSSPSRTPDLHALPLLPSKLVVFRVEEKSVANDKSCIEEQNDKAGSTQSFPDSEHDCGTPTKQSHSRFQSHAYRKQRVNRRKSSSEIQVSRSSSEEEGTVLPLLPSKLVGQVEKKSVMQNEMDDENKLQNSSKSDQDCNPPARQPRLHSPSRISRNSRSTRKQDNSSSSDDECSADVMSDVSDRCDDDKSCSSLVPEGSPHVGELGATSSTANNDAHHDINIIVELKNEIEHLKEQVKNAMKDGINDKEMFLKREAAHQQALETERRRNRVMQDRMIKSSKGKLEFTAYTGFPKSDEIQRFHDVAKNDDGRFVRFLLESVFPNGFQHMSATGKASKNPAGRRGTKQQEASKRNNVCEKPKRQSNEAKPAIPEVAKDWITNIMFERYLQLGCSENECIARCHPTRINKLLKAAIKNSRTRRYIPRVSTTQTI